MADEPDEWQSFHQQEDLTTRLHNILEEYPAGVGIFKEFLQNADDAGARKFAIVWDQRSHCSALLVAQCPYLAMLCPSCVRMLASAYSSHLPMANRGEH